jgi:hypothetical protein
MKKNCHSSGRNPLLCLFIKNDDKPDCSENRVISLLPTAYIMLSSILLSRLIHTSNELLGLIRVAVNIIAERV